MAKSKTAVPSPTYHPVDITPALAREWLKRNTHNRPIDERRVDEFAGAMKRGEWIENGDTFRFDRNGVLIDGQKRLLAVVKSNVTIPGVAVENLDPDEAQLTVDNGQPRSFGQQLKLLNYKSAASLASTTRFIYMWEMGLARDKGARITFHQLLRFLRLNEDQLIEVNRWSQSFAHKVGVPALPIALTKWLFDSLDEGDSEAFFDKWQSGIGFEEGDPIHALTRWIRGAFHNYTQGRPPSREITASIIIKAWNAWRRGEKVGTLSWKAGGRGAESLPTPE